jgi:hypothetical protein
VWVAVTPEPAAVPSPQFQANALQLERLPLQVESEASKLRALRPNRREEKQASLVLDNLGQVRFYSAWRGAVERERRG